MNPYEIEPIYNYNFTTGAEDADLTLDLSGVSCVGRTAGAVRTSGSLTDGENWAELPEQTLGDRCLRTRLKAGSVTTFLIGETRI